MGRVSTSPAKWRASPATLCAPAPQARLHPNEGGGELQQIRDGLAAVEGVLDELDKFQVPTWRFPSGKTSKLQPTQEAAAGGQRDRGRLDHQARGPNVSLSANGHDLVPTLEIIARGKICGIHF